MPTHSGATIKTALDYALTLNASKTNEVPWIDELLPDIGAVAATYGDPDGKYIGQLDRLQSGWQAQGWVVWDQPLKMDVANGTLSGPGSSASSTNNGQRTMVNLLLAFTGLHIGYFL